MRRPCPKRRSRGRDEVTATQLAEMGFCEKRMQLAHEHGDRVTHEQQRAIIRGRVAHQRYFEEGAAGASDCRRFLQWSFALLASVRWLLRIVLAWCRRRSP